MPAFALPQAVSPRVAATLSRFAHYGLLDRACQRARTYAIAPTSDTVPHAAPDDLPRELTLIFDERDRGKPTQLHLGRLPVPARFWSYDADRGILLYRFQSAGVDHVGSLTFVHAASAALGTLSVGNQHIGVKATLQPISYNCDVAMTHAAFVTGVAPALNLHWDATDPRWSSATWVKDALTFTWQLTGQVIVGQPTYSIAVSFVDPQTQAAWTPLSGQFSALLDANLDFTMTLAGGETPPADNRNRLPAPGSNIVSVFPYLMAFTLSGDSAAITGALLTGEASQAGNVLGLRGTVVNPSAAGLYSVSDAHGAVGAIAVYAGRLYINDTLVATSSIKGDQLSWSGLTTAQQQHSNLPQSGALTFSADGVRFQVTQGNLIGRRLRPEQVARQFAGTPLAAHPAIVSGGALSATAKLSPQALGAMTQFACANHVWVDAVQQATMNDFNNILVNYMPKAMRETYYNVPLPILPAWLKAIAAQGTNPAAAYESLATAYLTNILSHFSEDGASQLNAARAVTWLKSQTAASPVFQQHTTAIYSVEFVNKIENAALPQYLQDQANPPPTYATYIATDVLQWRKTLAATIQDATSLTTMQQLATELSALAISANLYWAYTFFRYLTTPAQLMTIQMISLGNTTDLDGSAFMRQCQSNAAILSLLDPSNVFSQKYVEVIQVFQIGNMLPTLFDLSGTDTADFVFDIQLVLAKIAAGYEGNSDPKVAQAAAEANVLAQDQNLRDYVEIVQSIASASAGLAAWEQLAPAIESKLAAKIGGKAAGLFMTALAGVGVMGIVFGSMQWKTLTADQQASLIAGGAALAIQFVCAVVKRGVAIAGLFDSSASGWEIFKGLLSGDIFKSATFRLNNGFAQWITERDVDVDRNAFKRYALVSDPVTGEPEPIPEESLASKIFGRNLDDFLATRLGAALAVINLVLSIYDAVNATDPFERIADSLMAAAAGLDLIAAAGGWALGAAGIAEIGGVAVATICSMIGVLAILAALVGVAILLYLIFRPQPNPVQQFISAYAGPAGFAMPYGSEIDYFVGYDQKTEPQRLGCSFIVAESPLSVLSIADDGTTINATSQSYDYKSIFVISTNGSGQSRVIALVPNKSGGLQVKVLTFATDNSVSFQTPLDPKNTNYYTQLWSFQMQGPPRMDGSFPAAGKFRLTASGTTSVLAWNGIKLVLGSGPDWTIAQAPMAVAGLLMHNIKLYTFSRSQSFRPTLIQDGSSPKTWSITPALPSFLTLDPTSGRISQAAMTSNLPVTPSAKYAISVTNQVGTAPAPASFTVEVDSYP